MCYLEVLIKTVSFDVTKSYVVFHHTPRVIIEIFILFSKEKMLCFVSLGLFIEWKIDLLEKSVVVTAEISS